MTQFLRHGLALFLYASLLTTATVSAAGRLDKPVVQESIPSPGEAVARMAARKRDAKEAAERTDNPLLFDVADESSKEMERIGEDPIPPGLMGLQETQEAAETTAKTTPIASPAKTKPTPPIATQQKASNQTVAPIQPQTTAPAIQKASAVQTPAKKTATSMQQRLAELTAKRTAGEISGETYLAERHRIIYGQPAPIHPQKKPTAHGPSVEQRLNTLTQQRKRGEISGEAYLTARRQIINGE